MRAKKQTHSGVYIYLAYIHIDKVYIERNKKGESKSGRGHKIWSVRGELDRPTEQGEFPDTVMTHADAGCRCTKQNAFGSSFSRTTGLPELR